MDFVRDVGVRLTRFRADVLSGYHRGGVRATVPVVGRLIGRQLYRMASFAELYVFDRKFGLDTRGWRTPDADAVARSLHRDNTDFEPMSVRELGRIFAGLPADPAGLTFVDLGCGKGGPLAVAALHRFHRVIGVELDSRLARTARRNAAVLQARTPTRIEVVEADASTYRLPPEPTLLFLYNPFGAGTMGEVAKSVVASLHERPRPLFVLYVNPVHRQVWDAIPELRPIRCGRPPRSDWAVRQDREWVLYAAGPGDDERTASGADTSRTRPPTGDGPVDEPVRPDS
ncbi:methyltransferase domain-containing protein [Geodermatophilus sp. SYSU D00525]